jgi:hypothetical protein
MVQVDDDKWIWKTIHNPWTRETFFIDRWHGKWRIVAKWDVYRLAIVCVQR